MGPTYAGFLGSLAMLTRLAHGVIHASPAEAVLLEACLALVVFAVVGYVVGHIAEHALGESVRTMVEAEVTENRSTDNPELTP